MQNNTGGDKLLDINLVLKKVQIDEKMHVADFGCGASGHFVFPTAKIVGSAGKVYAVDILKTVLETIERRKKIENFENIVPVWSNLEVFGAAKIESGSIDIAFLINTLYQSHKRANILREAIRTVKKGGKVVVVEWKNISIPFGPPIKKRVNAENLKTGGAKLGLKLEEEFNAGPYHYGLIFSKL